MSSRPSIANSLASLSTKHMTITPLYSLKPVPLHRNWEILLEQVYRLSNAEKIISQPLHVLMVLVTVTELAVQEVAASVSVMAVAAEHQLHPSLTCWVGVSASLPLLAHIAQLNAYKINSQTLNCCITSSNDLQKHWLNVGTLYPHFPAII